MNYVKSKAESCGTHNLFPCMAECLNPSDCPK